MASTPAAPGWYPDPNGGIGQRYFDGTQWTDQTAPAPAYMAGQAPPPQKKPAGCFRTVFSVFAVLLFIGFVASKCDSRDSSSSSSSSSSYSATITTTEAYATPTSEEPAPSPTSTFTAGQQNAIDKAQSYLNYTAFSKKGLIDQLVHDEFSTEDATFAVNNIESNGGVNWDEQAAKKAKSYLDFTSFSKSGLIDQLEHDDFTPEQAQYGVNTAYGG